MRVLCVYDNVCACVCACFVSCTCVRLLQLRKGNFGMINEENIDLRSDMKFEEEQRRSWCNLEER